MSRLRVFLSQVPITSSPDLYTRSSELLHLNSPLRQLSREVGLSSSIFWHVDIAKQIIISDEGKMTIADFLEESKI